MGPNTRFVIAFSGIDYIEIQNKSFYFSETCPVANFIIISENAVWKK